MVILLLFNIRETGGTRNTRKSNFSRSNPPRLVNEWAKRPRSHVPDAHEACAGLDPTQIE
jgi:hypothetical protein